MIAKRLSCITKEIDIPGTEKAKVAVENYCETIEKEILSHFDNAYKDGDVETMAACAKILVEFNGGQSCIQIFVNQHEFFTTGMRSREEELNVALPVEIGSR